jgi:hypothetical protein
MRAYKLSPVMLSYQYTEPVVATGDDQADDGPGGELGADQELCLRPAAGVRCGHAAGLPGTGQSPARAEPNTSSFDAEMRFSAQLVPVRAAGSTGNLQSECVQPISNVNLRTGKRVAPSGEAVPTAMAGHKEGSCTFDRGRARLVTMHNPWPASPEPCPAASEQVRRPRQGFVVRRDNPVGGAGRCAPAPALGEARAAAGAQVPSYATRLRLQANFEGGVPATFGRRPAA